MSRCRDVRLPSGAVIRVRGDRAPTDDEVAMLDEIAVSARARMAEEDRLDPGRADRQAAAIDRIRARAARRTQPGDNPVDDA